MRCGSLVFTTTQGLGILAKSFHDHGIVTDVMRVRHSRRPEHPEWYPGTEEITNVRSDGELARAEEFCAGQDVMLFFETPFMWPLIDRCRAMGVKTVLMPMYECSPDPLPAIPDAFFCPSLLDYECFGPPAVSSHPMWCPEPFRLFRDITVGSPKAAFTPVPVDTARVKWRRREWAETFVHNAGHGGLKGRNGTLELLEALPHVKSPARFIIRAQPDGMPVNFRGAGSDPRVTVDVRNLPYEELYSEGDVFLFPEKFNGLSLPLQEACAAGMAVMATDRFPMNLWLPNPTLHCASWRVPLLIPTSGSRRNRVGMTYREFDEAVVDPLVIARCVDGWYGEDVSGVSEMGGAWAEDHSWDVLGPKYRELLEELVQ